MRCPHAILVGTALAGLILAQGPSPRDWIAARYPDLRVVPVQDVQSAAAETGFATTPAQQLALKRAYQELRARGRHALPAWKEPTQGPSVGGGPEIGTDLNVFEHESNDGWQWADDMNGQNASGDCSLTDDVDCWKFTASSAGFYSFSVQQRGTSPISDSLLVLRNHKGDPIASDDNGGTGLLSRINVFLPVGTYYLDVSSYFGTNGGEYDLVAQSDDVSVATLTGAGGIGTTRIPVGGLAHDVFQFTVPESRVEIAVSSTVDTALVVQRADGVVFFSNDDSSVGGTNAAADIDLPAGTYYAYVWDVGGGTGAAFTLSFVSTPISIPDVALSLLASAAIVGDESMRLLRCNLAAATHVDAMTVDGPASPIGDTVLALLDSDLDYVLDVDDDDPFDPARGFYSRISMSLPAADYLFAVTPFPGAAGQFTLTCALGPYAPTGTGAFGGMATQIAGFGLVNTYTISNCTQASIQVRGSDFWFGILGPDGQLATNTRSGVFWPQAGELPGGTSTLFVWDRYDFSGPLTLTLVPPLHYVGDVITSRGKEGDMSWLFANFSTLAPPFNFGAGDRGFLCLPLDPLLMTVGDRTLPASGVASWVAKPPGLTGVDLQTGDLHLGVTWPLPALGTWRNCEHF
jgi:hypothetical protein